MISKIKDDVQIGMLLTCFVGHPVVPQKLKTKKFELTDRFPTRPVRNTRT